MPYNVNLTSSAIQDIQDATAYYNDLKKHQGNLLFIEISEVIDLLFENPFMFQKRYRDVRKANISKFNFSIFYFIEGLTVTIIAVLHNSRNPMIWQDRV